MIFRKDRNGTKRNCAFAYAVKPLLFLFFFFNKENSIGHEYRYCFVQLPIDFSQKAKNKINTSIFESILNYSKQLCESLKEVCYLLAEFFSFQGILIIQKHKNEVNIIYVKKSKRVSNSHALLAGQLLCARRQLIENLCIIPFSVWWLYLMLTLHEFVRLIGGGKGLAMNPIWH